MGPFAQKTPGAAAEQAPHARGHRSGRGDRSGALGGPSVAGDGRVGSERPAPRRAPDGVRRPTGSVVLGGAEGSGASGAGLETRAHAVALERAALVLARTAP